MKHPVWEAPGQSPWRDFPVRDDGSFSDKNVVTAVTKSGIHLVEIVTAHDSVANLIQPYEGGTRESAHGYDLISRSYPKAVLMTAVGHEPGQKDHPVKELPLVRWCYNGSLVSYGSHQEQRLRAQLSEGFKGTKRGWVGRAEKKAEKLLMKHLDPQQRIDYLATNSFFVKGRINKLYRLELYNGVQIVQERRVRRENRGHPYEFIVYDRAVSICNHPDFFTPGCDVLLAHKLQIEADEERFLVDVAPGLRVVKQTPLKFFSWKTRVAAWASVAHSSDNQKRERRGYGTIRVMPADMERTILELKESVEKRQRQRRRARSSARS